jgi:hypothetical protein
MEGFVRGEHVLVLSNLTVQELAAAPADVLTARMRADAQHIVNLQRIHGYNSVNLRKGYPMMEIRTPREVLSDE